MKNSAQNSDKVELLAPAGSFDALKLAVNAGADAVYFGAGTFNARRAAKPIEIQEAVDYCHLFGAKAYLALNIIIKNSEFSEVQEVIRQAYLAKIDAFILTDLGLLQTLRDFAPMVPLHASTQLGVASKKGAEFLQSLGFRRVVLAREAGLEEIRAVKETGIEVEYFVHGALCVGYSGSCLLSSIENCDSGNRGLCKQPCRLPYRLEISKNFVKDGYILSPKDQCLMGRLTELKEAGVDSFKIEGRLKRDAYAGGVTEIYRKAADGESVGKPEISVLKRLFNRGDFSEGYAFEKKESLMFPSVQSSIGERVGKITKIENNSAKFCTEKEFEKEDGFKILRGGCEINAKISEVCKETKGTYSFRTSDLKIGDEVRITDDASLDRAILSETRKIAVSFFARFLVGQTLSLQASAEGQSVTVFGGIAEAAKNAPMSAADIRETLAKLGDTEFCAEHIEIETDGIFVRKSEANALRRNATEKLRRLIIKCNEPIYENFNISPIMEKTKLKGVFSEVDSLEKAFSVPSEKDCYLVFRPKNFIEKEVKSFSEAFRSARPTQKLFLWTPPMLLKEDEETVGRLLFDFDGLVANSLSAVKIALDAEKLLICGVNLNIANTENPLIKLSSGYLISVELNSVEQKQFHNGTLYAFGKLPLMYFRHCPKQSVGILCKNCKIHDTIILKDNRYEFDIERFVMGGECRFRLLNAINTDLANASAGCNRYLDFTSVTSEEIPAIFSEYRDNTRTRVGEYTLLHTKRGVR